MANVRLGEPSSKERAIFVLRTLLELVENDRVRADEIEGKTTEEIIELGEAKAAEAKENADRLASGN